jgi:uncharacterized membrane protein
VDAFSVKKIPFVWLLVAAHLVVAIPLAWALNLWIDEAWTMQTTARGVVYALSEGVSGERQAPLYFVLLAVWRFFDDSLFFARLFSILCTAASVFAFDRIADKIFAGKEKLIFVAFFALHPYTIWAALEARGYALAIFLSCLLILFWLDAYAAERQDGRKQIFYLIVAVLALYTNYYFGFLLVANAAALVVLRRWSALKNYLWQMAAVAVAAAPLFLIVQQQFSVRTAFYRVEPSLKEGLKTLWEILNNFILPAESEILSKIRAWVVRLGILAAAFVLLKSKLLRLSPLSLAFGAIVGVVAVFFLAIYYRLGVDYVQMRHAAILFLPAMLFLGSILKDSINGVRVWLIIATVLALFSSAALVARYTPLTKRGDAERIARFIEKNEQNNQPIVVFTVYNILPLKFYYRGSNQFVPKPEVITFDWNAEDAPDSATRWQRQINFITSQIPPEQQEMWLVTEDFCDAPETMIQCQPLEDFLRGHYVVERTEFFLHRKVRLLRRK